MKAKQQGNALLLAVLLVAVCAIVMVAIVDKQNIQFLRTEALLRQARLQANASGVQIWAAHFLQTDFYKQELKSGTLLMWPKILRYTTEDGVKIQGTLYDAQSFYNLNNLSDKNYQTGFANFLHGCVPSLDAMLEQGIIKATTAWLLPAGENSDTISESYYLNANPPYLTAHRFFISPSEWRYVKDISPQIYLAAAPYIIALPDVTKVNINTAPAVVLMSLGATLSPDQAQQIIAMRITQKGFANTSDLATLLKKNNITLNESMVTTQSEYFLLRTDIEYQRRQFLMFNLYERKLTEDKKNKVTLLWTSIGML